MFAVGQMKQSLSVMSAGAYSASVVKRSCTSLKGYGTMNGPVYDLAMSRTVTPAKVPMGT